jgi:putrescine transport system permease protein
VRALAWIWLGLVAGLPLLVLLAAAFGAPHDGVPPVLWPWEGAASLEAWRTLAADDSAAMALLRSLLLAGVTATLCAALAFPMALGVLAAAPRWRVPLALALLLPFLAGFVLRMAAWVGLLRDSGWMNAGLLRLGLIEEPLRLLHTDFALLLGMVHAYLPFAALPLLAHLWRRDLAVEEAAADLGASPFAVFRSVTLPMAAPALLAAFLLVFIPAAGEYVIPELLGPPGAPLAGRAIWAEFFTTRDWPTAAAMSVALLALLALPVALAQKGRGA